MTRIHGSDCTQMLLLPEVVDDYVSPDNPVRFIEAFVDGLDLAVAGLGPRSDQSNGPAEIRHNRPCSSSTFKTIVRRDGAGGDYDLALQS